MSYYKEQRCQCCQADIRTAITNLEQHQLVTVFAFQMEVLHRKSGLNFLNRCLQIWIANLYSQHSHYTSLDPLVRLIWPGSEDETNDWVHSSYMDYTRGRMFKGTKCRGHYNIPTRSWSCSPLSMRIHQCYNRKHESLFHSWNWKTWHGTWIHSNSWHWLMYPNELCKLSWLPTHCILVKMWKSSENMRCIV